LLTVRIDSGRKHQIRRHLAELGFPVLGDRLYGDNRQGQLSLCAWSLQFICPVEQISRHYELPEALIPADLQ